MGWRSNIPGDEEDSYSHAPTYHVQRISSGNLGSKLCEYTEYLTRWKKQTLTRAIKNPNRKLGVTTHFSEIIKLKFGRKLSNILCILKLFWYYGCFIIFEKRLVTHIFLFRFQAVLRMGSSCFPPPPPSVLRSTFSSLS